MARVRPGGGDGGVGLRRAREEGELHPALSLFNFLGRGDVSFVFPYGVVGGPTMTGKAGLVPGKRIS